MTLPDLGLYNHFDPVIFFSASDQIASNAIFVINGSHRVVALSGSRIVSLTQLVPGLTCHKMEHSGHVSNEDRLFMSSPPSYPGQGSFTITVQGGQVSSVRPGPQESWRPQHLAQVDALASSMMSMELGQVRIGLKQHSYINCLTGRKNLPQRLQATNSHFNESSSLLKT